MGFGGFGDGGALEGESCGREVRRLWARRRETRDCWIFEAWAKGVMFGRWTWESRIADLRWREESYEVIVAMAYKVRFV